MSQSQNISKQIINKNEIDGVSEARVSDRCNPLKEYINSLSEMEKKVLQIAIEHLETSFSLEKSIGYQKWLKNKTAKS